MKRTKRPRVIVRCGADHYAGEGERILEVSFDGGAGALISLRQGRDTGKPRIEVYRTDGEVDVIAPREDVARQAALDGSIACEECGALIPDRTTGTLENRHHAESCSLYDSERD